MVPWQLIRTNSFARADQAILKLIISHVLHILLHIIDGPQCAAVLRIWEVKATTFGGIYELYFRDPATISH